MTCWCLNLKTSPKAGISISLAGGRTAQAVVDPRLLRRLLEAVNVEELGDFVHAVGDAVENPDERPFRQS